MHAFFVSRRQLAAAAVITFAATSPLLLACSGGSESGDGAGTGSSTSSGGTDGSGGSTEGAGGTANGTGGNDGSGGSSGISMGPIGFASENGGTIGGEGGTEVTVTTYAELVQHAASPDPRVIYVDGTISNGPGGGVINVASNKSIIGVGSTAFLSGVGIGISSQSNIIIQNLRISLVGVTTPTAINDGDAISVSGASTHLWIDHCELFSEDPGVQTNVDLYDGLIDIKGPSGFITISYNYLHDHHKGGLVGSSDTDLFADRKITFHHNHYDNVRLRVPMYRGSVGHFFNNYVSGAEDATEIRAGTCVRVERNYYEPLHFSIYTPSDSVGSTELIGNIEVMREERDHPPDCVADIPYDYSSVLIENAEDVKTLVPAGAGVGHL